MGSESSKRICTLGFTLDFAIDLCSDVNKVFKFLVHQFFFQKKNWNRYLYEACLCNKMGP